MTIQRRLFHVYISTKSIQSHFRLISYNVIFFKEKSGNGQRSLHVCVKPTRSVFPLYLINYICKFCIFHFTIFMFGEINTLELYPSTIGEWRGLGGGGDITFILYSHLPRKFKIFPSFIQCRYNYCCSFFIKSCRLSTISILFIGLKLGQKMMFMHFTLSFFRTISDSFFACGLFSQGSQIKKKTTCVAYPFLFSELCNFFDIV